MIYILRFVTVTLFFLLLGSHWHPEPGWDYKYKASRCCQVLSRSRHTGAQDLYIRFQMVVRAVRSTNCYFPRDFP